MYFPLFVGVLCLSLFGYALLCVHSSSAIILQRNRKLVALLLLSCRCIGIINVLWLFLTVPCVGLQYVIVIILTYFFIELASNSYADVNKQSDKFQTSSLAEYVSMGV